MLVCACVVPDMWIWLCNAFYDFGRSVVHINRCLRNTQYEIWMWWFPNNIRHVFTIDCFIFRFFTPHSVLFSSCFYIILSFFPSFLYNSLLHTTFSSSSFISFQVYIRSHFCFTGKQQQKNIRHKTINIHSIVEFII